MTATVKVLAQLLDLRTRIWYVQIEEPLPGYGPQHAPGPRWVREDVIKKLEKEDGEEE